MKIISITLAFIISLMSFTASAQFTAYVEGGAVFNGYNDVRIPGSSGTKFSLTDDLSGNPSAYYRLSIGYTIASRHNITLLFSPLDMTYKGCMDNAVSFAGSSFAANDYLEAKYKFYSYRLTYRYDIIKREKIDFGLGVTAKIRDAKISLRSASQYAQKTNTGFVPIINFRLNWKYHPQWGLLFEGDALGAPQGRAEDIRLATTFNAAKNLQLSLGYRLLEGGSDSSEVYTFSMFHYISFGVSYSF